ncbi:MAG TPA: ABC transporter permease [bacterium]|nr:ABC transporter permease [bacterium]
MLYLALKQLLARPRQTLLALLGITFGTAAFLILSGMMLGFREYLIQRLINTTAHISIKAEEPTLEEHSLDPYFFPDTLVKWVVPPVVHNEPPHIEYPQGWFDRLEADPNVLAYAPQITTQVMVNRGKLTRSIILIGVDAHKQVGATDVKDDMTVGDFLDLDKGGFKVIIGESLAQKLGIHVNDTLNIVEIRGVVVPAKVAGFFNTGMTQVDDVTAYAPLHYVQQANQTPGEIAQIIVKLKDITLARKIADQWATTSREKVQSWDEANANFFQVFAMQDMIRYILSFVVLMIAAFGIYNILNMMILQKRGEIAILRSMGYEAGDIIRLFLSQGLILGFIGGILGLCLGTLVCLYVESITFNTGVSITRINHMLIAWHLRFYVMGFLLAFLSGLVAGYLPARAASRMHPIDILRAEGG